jgi:hypothetical protein
MRALVIALLIVAGFARPAEARRVDARFFMDFAPGIAVPIADAPWRAYTSPSFKFSLRVGAELWLARGFGIAGEVDLDPEPLITTDRVQGRFRGMVGFRLLFGFGIGAFFIRHAIGADYISRIPSGNILEAQAALAVEPGVGVQFRVIRHMVVGFTVDFPVGFFQSLTAVDVQFLGFLGARF